MLSSFTSHFLNFLPILQRVSITLRRNLAPLNKLAIDKVRTNVTKVHEEKSRAELPEPLCALIILFILRLLYVSVKKKYI